METNLNDVQSRRSFFRNLAKAALPVLSVAVVSSFPVKVQAANPGICSGCIGYCTGCQFSCDQSCSGKCLNTCDGCSGCSGTETNSRGW